MTPADLASPPGDITTQGWQDMRHAQTDGTPVEVFCPEYEDLPALMLVIKWHPVGGWCCDELRAPCMWRHVAGAPGDNHG